MPVTEESVPILPHPAPPAEPDSRLRRLLRWLRESKPEFRVGTLRYTGFGLIMVFIWLLWGDFCFTLLDQNIPALLPLKLKEIGASDTMNSVLNGTLSYAVTFFLAPMVSVKSDRTRTRWGRRIPYLFWSTPFVGLFLVLIGCYDSVTRWVFGDAAHASVLGIAAPVFILGVLLVGWDLANIFVNTIYYYLFNDVVPARYMSRFFAMFRIVISLAGMAFSKWVYPHWSTHFRSIFVIAGIAYAVGFLLMCLFLREGEYPPPEQEDEPGFLAKIKTYAKECFTHRLYWFFFLATACTFSARLTSNFVKIRNRSSLGLTDPQIGDYDFWYIGIALLLQYPAGWLSDRFHPLRVYLIATSWALLGTACQCLWIFRDFGQHGNLLYMYITGLSFMPLLLIADAAELPMYMRLLPKDRYGQFASANGMVRAFAKIFLSVGIGSFLGSLAARYGERRYTFIAAWQLFFQILAVFFLVLLYRQWKLHGGNTSYVPPGTNPDSALSLPARA